jgi:hypothetical protein
MNKPDFVTARDGVTKGVEMGRPTRRKDGLPMTDAERQARRRKRKGKSINRRRRTLRKEAKLSTAAAARREASRNAPPLPDGAELRIGDCREALADIADNSIPLILTDPPYGKEAEPLYKWLAEFAARVLIPGGSLICYTGSTMLHRDLSFFKAQPALREYPLCRMVHTHPQQLYGLGILATDKPVLWFAKGHSRHRTLMPTEFVSPRPDKLAHAWAQGEGGVWVPIEHLSEPGELILDPFAGTGTWGRIAAAMGRRWIGADIVQGGTETIAAGSLTPP